MCIFVGYDEHQKGFRVMDEYNCITVARDVKFLAEEPSTVTFTSDNDENEKDVVDLVMVMIRGFWLKSPKSKKSSTTNGFSR